MERHWRGGRGWGMDDEGAVGGEGEVDGVVDVKGVGVILEEGGDESAKAEKATKVGEGEELEEDVVAKDVGEGHHKGEVAKEGQVEVGIWDNEEGDGGVLGQRWRQGERMKRGMVRAYRFFTMLKRDSERERGSKGRSRELNESFLLPKREIVRERIEREIAREGERERERLARIEGDGKREKDRR
ncbi:hypothetical protein ACLOJK_019964 [Asimina triloba]